MSGSTLKSKTAVVRRLEVPVGDLGRRRWPDAVKAGIIAESFAPGAVVAGVARRHGLTPQQLFAWRRRARQEELWLHHAVILRDTFRDGQRNLLAWSTPFRDDPRRQRAGNCTAVSATAAKGEVPMEWNVWSLKHVTRNHRDVIVILLAWNRFSNKITDELKKHTKEFGALMTYRGILVMPYEERMKDALDEVLEKPWPGAIAERIRGERYPFLLIIDKDFEQFDPGHDDAAFVWFSDFRDNEDPIWEVLDTIARKISARENIIAYLTSVQEKSRSDKLRERLARLAEYVDVSIPIVPGVVSVKAGTIWADIMSD